MLAAITYTLTIILAMGLVGLVAGSIAWGFHPLTSLSGTKVSAGHGVGLLAASLAIYAFPLVGIAAFGLMLSTITRNSAAAVVGTLMWALLMQLLGVLPGTESFRAYLLGTQFDAWHGFLRTPADWSPVIRAVWVCGHTLHRADLWQPPYGVPATRALAGGLNRGSRKLKLDRRSASRRRGPCRRPRANRCR